MGSVLTTQFIRKPLYVDAVRITGANFDEIVSWCQGEEMQDEVPGKGTGKKYIKVRVHNPKNPRQTKAFVGDWLLYTERGYKVYTNKAFHASFHTVEEDTRSEQELGSEERVQDDANISVIGPECFAKKDGSVLSWRGVNYVPQGEVGGNAHFEGGSTAERLEEQLGEGLVGPDRHIEDVQRAVGPDIEVVPATPESIAQAVRENEEARSAEYPETHTIGGTPREEIDLGVANPRIGQEVNPNAVFSQGGGGPVDLSEDVKEQPKTVDDVPQQEKVDPTAAEGKRVLSVAEQKDLGPDEIRELIQSGEVVLAQDIAAA